MDKGFDAQTFVARLLQEEFDEDLADEVRSLSALQLEQVVFLLEHLPETETKSTSLVIPMNLLMALKDALQNRES